MVLEWDYGLGGGGRFIEWAVLYIWTAIRSILSDIKLKKTRILLKQYERAKKISFQSVVFLYAFLLFYFLSV